jgi:hypothetical protein
MTSKNHKESGEGIDVHLGSWYHPYSFPIDTETIPFYKNSDAAL